MCFFEISTNARDLSAAITQGAGTTLETKPAQIRLILPVQVCVARNIDSTTRPSAEYFLIVEATHQTSRTRATHMVHEVSTHLIGTVYQSIRIRFGGRLQQNHRRRNS